MDSKTKQARCHKEGSAQDILRYQFTKVSHITSSESDEIWCVHGYPKWTYVIKRNFAFIACMASRKWFIKICDFCCTSKHSNSHIFSLFIVWKKDTEKFFSDTVLAERPRHQYAFTIIGGSSIRKDVFCLVGLFYWLFPVVLFWLD